MKIVILLNRYNYFNNYDVHYQFTLHINENKIIRLRISIKINNKNSNFYFEDRRATNSKEIITR